MAQHDYNIANGTGAAVRSDLNNALAAIVSQNSGATEPATMFAYQWWADTTTGLLKQRNAANNAWVTIGTLASTNLGLLASGGTLTSALGSASTPGITFTGDTNTGIYSPGADQVAVATGGTGRLFVDSSGRVGLGTTTPNANLHVKSGTDKNTWIYSHPTYGNSLIGINDVGDTYTSLSIGASPLIFRTAGGTEAARIDSSGRVGIGTTTASTLLHLASSDPVIRLQDTDTNAYGQIAVDNSGNVTIQADESNAQASSSIRLNVDGSEKVRLDSSGRFLVGTSTARDKFNNSASGQDPLVQFEAAGTAAKELYMLSLTANNSSPGSNSGVSLMLARSGGSTVGSYTTVASGDSIGNIRFQGADGSEFVEAASIQAFVDGTPGANDMPGRLVFSTTADGASSPTERMRISNNGKISIGTTGSSGLLTVETSLNENIAYYQNTSTTLTDACNGIRIIYSQAAPNSATAAFLRCGDNLTPRAELRSNGGLANYSANNVNLSDRNVKKDIVPVGGTWDCLKEWEIVNFRYKDQPDDADLNMGVIAQQVAESCPEVITVFQQAKEATETEPAQEERIGVKEQQMMWMAIKALQEAQIRIETLEAEVAALKAS